jgi:hypothetical protein
LGCGLAVALLLLAADERRVAALMTDSRSVPGNVMTMDVLNPPTSLDATGGATVQLIWTATPDVYAAGHRVLRATASGGPYTEVAVVTPRTTTAYEDAPPLGTHYYIVTAYVQHWLSVPSNEVTCTSALLVFVC